MAVNMEGASPPVFEQIFRNARFAQGGNALFEGKVAGSPRPQVVWTRKGLQMKGSDKHQMMYDEASGKVSLLIKAIGPGDEGEYTCTALNPYGEAICTVYISPEATKQVKKSRSGHKLHKSKSGHDQQQLVMQQQQQQQVQQQQQFSQQSSMKQQFSQQSFQQSSVQQSSSIQQSAQSAQQMSSSSSMQQQSGSFQQSSSSSQQQSFQQSSNFQQSAISSSNNVQQQQQLTNGQIDPEEEALAPKFISTSSDHTCTEGDQVRMSCRVNGRPAPEIAWFKDGAIITQDDRHKIIVNEQGFHALLITAAQLSDTCDIGCLARNRSGEARFVCKLNVNPRATTMAPRFVEKLRSGRVEAGGCVTLRVKAVGNPTPSLAWQKVNIQNGHIV
jgi:hypothetical protein